MTKEIKLSDKTDKKQASPMLRETSFKKGECPNPNGRPKGHLNEVTKFKNAIEAFEKEQGKDIYKFIIEKANRYPQVLIAIFKALVPQQTESNIKIETVSPYKDLSDEELIRKANELLTSSITANTTTAVRRDISRA